MAPALQCAQQVRESYSYKIHVYTASLPSSSTAIAAALCLWVCLDALPISTGKPTTSNTSTVLSTNMDCLITAIAATLMSVTFLKCMDALSISTEKRTTTHITTVLSTTMESLITAITAVLPTIALTVFPDALKMCTVNVNVAWET